MHLLVILLLLSSNWLETGAEPLAEDASYYSQLQTILDESRQQSSLNNSFENAKDHEIFLSESLKQLSFDMEVKLDDVRSIIAQYNNHEEISEEVRLVETLINNIWTTVSIIFEHPNKVSTTTINDMKAALNSIHLNFTEYQPILKTNLLTWIGRLSDRYPYAFCEKKTSDQITMFNILKYVMAIEFNVLTATISYNRQHNQSLDNSTSSLDNDVFEMIRKLHSYMVAVEDVKRNRPSIIYSCDVGNYKRDENYIKIEGLVHPIFITHRLGSCEAVNMRANISSCTNLVMSSISTGSFFGNWGQFNCDNRTVDVLVSGRNEKPCYGYLSHCAPLKFREVCKNTIHSQPSTLKRYSWYKIDGEMFGNEDFCSNGVKETFKSSLQSERIHHCHCTCHDNGPESPTTHVLSLDWALSDIDDNKVVTGIKFTRTDKVIHLQIKQGILTREDHILSGSENWKAVSDIKAFGLDNKRNDKQRDINFLVLDENTIFDLDDVIARFQWAVTGVKFHQLEHGRIKLLVRQTRYNWKSGVLYKNINNREINPYPNAHELPVTLINPVLHQPQVPNMPDSISNSHYVKLRESSRKTDGGSTILPFFDTQKVEMESSSPLNGIGLYHRGSSESAGFISLKLITPDYGFAIANDNKKNQISK